MLFLEELVSSKLEGTLEEITGEGWANTGEEGAGTLSLDDLLEATNHAPVIGGRVELDSGLDAVYCYFCMSAVAPSCFPRELQCSMLNASSTLPPPGRLAALSRWENR